MDVNEDEDEGPERWLPERLKPFKVPNLERPTRARLPNAEHLIFLPFLRFSFLARAHGFPVVCSRRTHPVFPLLDPKGEDSEAFA